MGKLKFKGIGIEAIAAMIPSERVVTLEQTSNFDTEHLQGFIAKTGIEERRVIDANHTSSDLCKGAAEMIFEANVIGKDEIDALVFVSQSPDYRIPSTSQLLQDRLGLKTDIYTLDINNACSGYIWGLITAYSLCNSGFNNVLLCVGETPSKINSKTDSSTSLMFGDAGSASIIRKDEKFEDHFFSFNSDGSQLKAVYVPAGGFRTPSSAETIAPYIDQEGNTKTLEQLHMDGLTVFSYSVRAMTKDTKSLLEYANYTLDDIDTVVLHQANKFLNDKISKKLGIDDAKQITSLKFFGNTSSASIPLTMAFNADKNFNNDRLLFSAIGAAFTWASAIVKMNGLKNLGVKELK